MQQHSHVVNLDERRLKTALNTIAQALQDVNLLEPVPALVATPQPIAVSLKQAAELLDITPPTLGELVRSGKLRTFHIGRRRLIRLETLNEFTQAQEEEEARADALTTIRERQGD